VARTVSTTFVGLLNDPWTDFGRTTLILSVATLDQRPQNVVNGVVVFVGGPEQLLDGIEKRRLGQLHILGTLGQSGEKLVHDALGVRDRGVHVVVPRVVERGFVFVLENHELVEDRLDGLVVLHHPGVVR